MAGRLLKSIPATLILSGLALAQTLSPADQPSPRADANSQTAHADLLVKAGKGGIDVYFEGDSITRRWGTSDAQYKAFLENWTSNFYGWNAGNFGWGADMTQNILWRLSNGELDGVHPKVIVLMAGTNNVGAHAEAEDVTRGLQAIVRLMREKAPGATIILMGITPRNDRSGANSMPVIEQINANLAKFADGKSVRFLNINSKLADDTGRLYGGMTVDGLHLSATGYQIWADALKPLLTQLLGPPAPTDHAPPPTGDPSARTKQ